MSALETAQVAQVVADEVLGHGPIERLVRDPTVTEIMVNGPDHIYVERNGKLELTRISFVGEAHLRHVIARIVGEVGRHIDESSPMVDARLSDGSRVNAVFPPLCIGGPFLTIRKFAADPLMIEDLIDFGTLTPQVSELLRACVEGKANIMISGGAGTGKTTMLNVLSSFIPSDERIITIEDAKELQLHQDHVLCLEYRPANTEGSGEVTIRDLLRNSTFRTMSAWSPSKMRPNCGWRRKISCAWRPGRPTSKALEPSTSVSCSSTACVCAPTASLSASAVPARHSTCCKP